LWAMENICVQGTNRPCWACCPVQDLGFQPMSPKEVDLG
jgi:hypothetical protein